MTGSNGRKPDRKKGWIYVLYDPVSRHIKIGKTMVSVTKRLRDVQRNHGRASTKELYRSKMLKKRDMDRLERLVLSDLADHQAKYTCFCNPGGRVHQERFRTTPRRAIKSIRLWRQYLVKHKAVDRAGKVSQSWQTCLWRAVGDITCNNLEDRCEQYSALRTRIGHGWTRPSVPFN